MADDSATLPGISAGVQKVLELLDPQPGPHDCPDCDAFRASMLRARRAKDRVELGLESLASGFRAESAEVLARAVEEDGLGSTEWHVARGMAGAYDNAASQVRGILDDEGVR